MSPNKVKHIVRQYATVLEENKIPFENIYLFGSYAKKANKLHSDIDIAVVFNNFRKKKPSRIDRMMELWRLTPKVDVRIEPIVLEKSDFAKGKTSSMAHEVQKNGVLVI